MEAIQRLQAIDFVFVILWALVVGWGVRSGVISQGIMLLAMYVGIIAAGQAYKFIGGLLALTGVGSQLEMHVVAYGLLFFAVAAILALSVRRLYRHTLLAKHRRLDAVLGGVLGGVWGFMLLIAIVSILGFYVVTFMPGQQFTQTTVDGQLQRSQVVAILRGPLSPLWWIMELWFPDPLRPGPAIR